MEIRFSLVEIWYCAKLEVRSLAQCYVFTQQAPPTKVQCLSVIDHKSAHKFLSIVSGVWEVEINDWFPIHSG